MRMMTPVGSVAQRLFLIPRHHAASPCFPWNVRRGKGSSNIRGAEKTLLPISPCSAVGCLWQTGARG